MGIAWEFIRLRFLGKPFLLGLDAHTWSDHVEWPLGDEVYGMSVKDHLGEVVFRPAWHTLLSFELESRKAAYKLVNVKGNSLVQALGDIRKDVGLLQKHFVTPTAVAAGAEAARAAAGAASSSTQRPAAAPMMSRRPEEIGGRPAEGFEEAMFPFDGSRGKANGKGVPPPPRGRNSASWKKTRNPNTPDGR